MRTPTCTECGITGGHARGCPETPEDTDAPAQEPAIPHEMEETFRETLLRLTSTTQTP